MEMDADTRTEKILELWNNHYKHSTIATMVGCTQQNVSLTIKRAKKRKDKRLQRFYPLPPEPVALTFPFGHDRTATVIFNEGFYGCITAEIIEELIAHLETLKQKTYR